MRTRLKFLLFIVVMGVASMSLAVTAQRGVSTCSPAVQLALEEMGNNCQDAGRNTACYGYTLVQARLAADVDDDVQFDEPSDTVDIAKLTSISTAALDLDSEQWGVAMLRTQATLPNTLPGQGVVMLLMGDSELVNQVTLDQAFQPIDPIDVVVETGQDRARLRTGPDLSYNAVIAVESGTILPADGRSPDNNWLRVVEGDFAGWIFRDLTNIDTERLNALPELTDDLRAPMQAVYFTTGIGNPRCQDVPDALVVQSPQNVRMSFTANEAVVEIRSTIVLETLENGEMVMYVVDGQAIVNNLVVPAGFKAFVPIAIREGSIEGVSGEGIRVVETVRLPEITGEWRSCAPITDADRQWLSVLEDVDPNLLNYQIQLPARAEGICASPEEVAEIIQSEQIQDACEGFAPIAPLSVLQYGTDLFAWGEAPGASEYEITVYDEVENVVGSVTTRSNTSRISTGVLQPAGGQLYSWEVKALDENGSVVCESERVIVEHLPRPPVPDTGDDDDDDDDGNSNPEEPVGTPKP